MTDILDTSVGPAVLLHRLALAVECRDALSDGPAGSGLIARYRRVPTPARPDPPWRSLTRYGSSRFTLLHRIPDDPLHPLPRLQIAVDDPGRRFVPRRFTVTPWTYTQVHEPPVPVVPRARLLRVWLRPGSAYPFPRTGTVIRGRVVRGGKPARWARIEGTTATSVAGWAHADDRGEFVLPVVDPGYDPVRLDGMPPDRRVSLVVVAPRAPLPEVAGDRVADLVSEPIDRSANPPDEDDLDNPVLRGEAVPRGYAGNTAIVAPVDVPIGAALHLTADVDFAPQQ